MHSGVFVCLVSTRKEGGGKGGDVGGVVTLTIHQRYIHQRTDPLPPPLPRSLPPFRSCSFVDPEDHLAFFRVIMHPSLSTYPAKKADFVKVLLPSLPPPLLSLFVQPGFAPVFWSYPLMQVCVQHLYADLSSPPPLLASPPLL